MSHLSTVIQSWAQAWARRRLFVPLYLVLRLVALAILAPGVAAVVNLAVSLSDQTALTDQDIAFFILSPMGFLATLGALSILLVAEVLGFSVMAASLRIPDKDLWQVGSKAFALVLGRLSALLSFAALFVLRVLILVAPFAAVAGVIAWWTLTEYDINYYLTFHPPSFWVAVVSIGAVLLVLAWTLILRLSGWALALHLVIFEGVRPRDAFAESTKRMAGKQTRLKIELVIWLVTRLALASLIAAVVSAIAALVPVNEDANLRFMLTLIMAVMVLWTLAGLVLAATALGALAALLDEFFEGQVELPTETRDASSLRVRLFTVIGVGAIALIGGVWLGNGLLDAVDSDDNVEIIGHRGAAGSKPENTMAAIVQAIEDGADWVEIDVQETADGVVVVMHDSDFMKLSNVPLTIWDATMADLDDIDIGSWFDPAYADERTPTLRDVLAAAKGKSRVLIELKYYGHDVDLENRVASIVEELDMADEIATMSLKYEAVQKMRSIRPDWRAGVLAATAVGNLAGLDGDFIAVSTATARPALINAVHDAGKDFYVWTVNDPLEMSKMISLGVDGLITDEPALARKVLEFRAQLSPAERLILWLSEEMGWELNAKEYRDASP